MWEPPSGRHMYDCGIKERSICQNRVVDGSDVVHCEIDKNTPEEPVMDEEVCTIVSKCKD